MLNAVHAYRKCLSSSDLAWITDHLAQSAEEGAALTQLLLDPDTVDAILDHPNLLEALLNSIRCIT